MSKTKNVRTSVMLPRETHSRVQAVADANDVSVAWVIRYAVQKLLERTDGQLELPLMDVERARESRA